MVHRLHGPQRNIVGTGPSLQISWLNWTRLCEALAHWVWNGYMPPFSSSSFGTPPVPLPLPLSHCPESLCPLSSSALPLLSPSRDPLSIQDSLAKNVPPRNPSNQVAFVARGPFQARSRSGLFSLYGTSFTVHRHDPCALVPPLPSYDTTLEIDFPLSIPRFPLSILTIHF